MRDARNDAMKYRGWYDKEALVVTAFYLKDGITDARCWIYFLSHGFGGYAVRRCGG